MNTQLVIIQPLIYENAECDYRWVPHDSERLELCVFMAKNRAKTIGALQQEIRSVSGKLLSINLSHWITCRKDTCLLITMFRDGDLVKFAIWIWNLARNDTT